MARLAIIRQKREEAAAQRLAEAQGECLLICFFLRLEKKILICSMTKKLLRAAGSVILVL